MRYLGLLSLTFLWANLCLANPLMTVSSTDELRSYLVRKNYSGVILVADKDQILFREAFGLKNHEGGEAITINDKFQIGSNTKQMVSSALLKLQEEGKLSLDDKISQYISVPESYNTITIREMLNHTSGITNYTDHQEFWTLVTPTRILSLQEIIDFTLKYPLDFAPTTNWNYSNSNFIIAGKILEVVSGKKWDQYLQENFFSPLGMENTGYNDYFENVSDVASYVLNDKNQYEKVEDLNMSWALSAGAIYSTAGDLLKWLRHYSNISVLNQSSLKEMFTVGKNNYGLGLQVKSIDGDTFVSHNGRTPGFGSDVGHLVNRDMSFINLNNEDGGAIDVPSILYGLFVNGKVDVLKPQSIILSLDQLTEYIGNYKSGSFELKIYLKNGHLVLFPTGQCEFSMRPIEKDNFDLAGFAGEEFLRDDTGVIYALKHYQNGKTSLFPKETNLPTNQ